MGKKGKSHFGVAQVPARAAFRVWQGRSCSGGMSTHISRLDGAGPQGNARAQHNMASDASTVERVRTGSSKSWTI